MAMIQCGECRTSISSTATACPSCGAVRPKAKVWPWLVGIPVAAVAAFFLYGASIPEYRAKANAVRRVCEQMAANPAQCNAVYDQTLAEGRRSAEEKARPIVPADPPPPPGPAIPEGLAAFRGEAGNPAGASTKPAEWPKPPAALSGR